MEMGAAQLAVRMVGSLGRIDQQHLRTGALRDDEWPRLTEAVEQARQGAPVHRRDARRSPGELRAHARRLARQFGGKLGPDRRRLPAADERLSSGSDENRATELGEISRGLKALAKELQCPVIALSQLNRSVEIAQRQAADDERPARVGRDRAGRRRHHVHLPRRLLQQGQSKEPGVAEIIIAKQRNGPTGTVKLTFLKPLTRFENLAPGEAAEYQ